MAESVVLIGTFERAASINVTLLADMYAKLVNIEAAQGHKPFDPHAATFVLNICQEGPAVDHFRCPDGYTEDTLIKAIDSF